MNLGTPTRSELYAAALVAVTERAPAADRGETTLAADLALLHQTGLLPEIVRHTSVGGDPGQGASLLRALGRASLPVGRIVEGHANALRLIALYGSPEQRKACLTAAETGGIFGVWGADGKPPVTLVTRLDQSAVLVGVKNFCSGLGLLDSAVVPVRTEDGPLLMLVDVRDMARADASVWRVSGMRATASGRYDMTGLTGEILGQPRDYLREPHFEGGIWRYCALHCGGLEALTETVRRHLLTRGQQADPYQRARFARLNILARTARLWVEAASAEVERGTDVPSAVMHALLAREAVEQACLDGIAIADRALGTSAFDTDGEADRIRRDLAFFLRQANLDGKLAAAGEALLQPGRGAWC